MASGEKESGLAKKILDEIKYIANDVILLFQQIRDYEEKQELAILIGVVLAVFLLIKFFCGKKENEGIINKGANLQNVMRIGKGNFKSGGINFVANDGLSNNGNGLPRQQNVLDIADGANVDQNGPVNLIANGNLNDLQAVLDTKEYYPLAKTGKEGVCLILNYFKYENEKGETKNRTGTMKDAADLIDLFTGLNYNVMSFNDLNLETTKKKLKEAAKLYEQCPTYCSFILCILAHGVPDHILCNKEKLAYQDIFSYFTGPSMVGKPKLFFIQACQGGGADGGVGITPRDADRFTFVSSYAGKMSVRLPDKGTWFIQDLVKVFKEKAHHGTELNDLCTEVKGLVSKQTVGKVAPDGTLLQLLKQAPVAGGTLTKRFRFRQTGGGRGETWIESVRRLLRL
ncbi:Caspase-6 [Tyrophagus putrescentiae]|nr:Caspase-6 [Tyrophagus putrescentiae]